MKINIIILNVVIILFLSFSLLFPVFFLGINYTDGLWRMVWPLELLIVLALVGMNAFFIMNHRLFALLEKEDWPALTAYLEQKIFKDKRYTFRHVRILAQTYLVSGDFDGAIRLENAAGAEGNELVFGAARILSCNKPVTDPSRTVDFFKECLAPERIRKLLPGDAEWLRWYYGFSLILNRNIVMAEEVFTELAEHTKNPLVCGLSAYFLSQMPVTNSVPGSEQRTPAETAGDKLRSSLKNIDKWNRKTEKIKNEVHGIIIKQYLDEAGAWMFKEENHERN